MFSIREILGDNTPVIKIIAIGASWTGGNEKFYTLLNERMATLVAFEPNPEEHQKLATIASSRNQEMGFEGYKYLPYAIGAGKLESFHCLESFLNSSLLPPNYAIHHYLETVPKEFDIKSIETIQTIRLDDIQEIKDSDYLYLDTQGSELSIFENAKELLKSIVMIQTEVCFVPLYYNQPLFSDIDVLLREHGFYLHHYEGTGGRCCLPFTFGELGSFSQQVWCDFVYVVAYDRLYSLPSRKLLALATIAHTAYQAYDLAGHALLVHDRVYGTNYADRYKDRVLTEAQKIRILNEDALRGQLAAFIGNVISNWQPDKCQEAVQKLYQFNNLLDINLPEHRYAWGNVLSGNIFSLLNLASASNQESNFDLLLELYRQVRLRLFDFILQQDDEAIINLFPNFIEPGVNCLAACQDYHRFPYKDEEQEKITSTVQRCNELLQSRNSSGVMQCLLALRLYKMPHELDIPFDRFNVSGFFSRYYLCDFFNYQWGFAIHTDESDRNYRLQEVRLKLFAEICQRSPEIVSVVEQYLSCNHCVAILLLNQSTHDGKQIFIYYNKIIQYYLSSKSIATEWDFPLNSYSKDNKRIKAGLICNSLCMPDSSAAIPYIQSLDRNRFEIYIYTYDESSLESDFCPSGLTVKVLDQNLSSNIEAIRSDDLDILIFGHNINSKLLSNINLLGNCRVARIQVCTPLCPTTTGRKHIDYFISGDLSEVNSGQDAYIEKLITIEGSGLCFRKTDVDVSTCEYTRAQFNLPIDAVVYGSGANFIKSSPSARRVWLQVLKHIPNSFLVLYPFHSGWVYPSNMFTISYKRAVTRLAEELEINPDRIIFIYEKFPTRTDLVKFLQSVVDVYLDSFPYSGAFSLLDPLDAHIPVVTLKGKYLRQAQGGALLEELGLPELVAHDEQSYLDLALKLGRDQEFRATCSQKIKEGMINPPFRNCELFAQKLEKVYIDFVKVWRTQKLIKDAENNLKAGQIDQAYINYQLALELEPANPSALTGMGTISVQRGNLSEAESYYRQAISADETFAKAYWNLANLLSKSGNKEEANNFKQKAIELEPELAEIAYQQYTALAQSSLGNSNFTEAINLYRQALAVKPNDLVINETLAKILLASPWRRDAQPYIEVAQTLGTTDTAILGRNTDRFDLLDNLSISKQILYSSSNLDNEKVNFVYIVNRKSIDATLVSLYSIYHNNQSLNVSINLITEDLDLTDSIDKVINLARSLNIDCNLYRVTPEPWLSTNLLPAIPRIINDVDENIIYLASNTIVLKDISSLSQIELGSKFLVATPCGRNTLVKSILPISLGMAIINLKEWRKSNLGDIVLEMLYQHGNELSLEEAFNLTIDRFFFDRLFTLHPGYYHYLSSNQDSLPAKVMVIGYEINESKFSLYDYYYTNLVSYLH